MRLSLNSVTNRDLRKLGVPNLPSEDAALEALRAAERRYPDLALPEPGYAYLACGMTHGARDVPWLERLRDAAVNAGLRLYDPRQSRLGPKLREEWPELSDSSVALYDYLIVSGASVVVLDATHPSFGAAHEAMHALRCGVYVLAVADGPCSPFLRAHYDVVTSATACEVIARCAPLLSNRAVGVNRG